VFAEDMIGNALIYTTGKSSQLSESLWPYSLSTKALSGVSRDTDSNWTVHSVSESGGTITVNCSQDLADTEFSRATESVTIRAAWGGSGSLRLSYHGYGEYSSALEFDLLTGASEVIEDDYILEDVHAVLMSIAWALMAPIGIMASAFRGLLPEKGQWFKIHRAVQVAVVVLTVIGFVIAVLFTAESGNSHFSNGHMMMGLWVTILAVMQPLNALTRMHPPEDGWGADGRPWPRRVWEFVHKGSGYVAWVFSNLAITWGLFLRQKDTLAFVFLGGWCLAELIVYIALSVLGCKRKKTNDEINNVNNVDQNSTNTGSNETAQ